jgi:hypothetical protein
MRIEDRDDLPLVFESVNTSDSVVRQVFVTYLRENQIKRPQYNIVRNSGNVNDSDKNLEFYTTI